MNTNPAPQGSNPAEQSTQQWTGQPTADAPSPWASQSTPGQFYAAPLAGSSDPWWGSAPSATSSGQTAPVNQLGQNSTAFTTAPQPTKPRGRSVMGLVALAIVAAGIGGGTAVGATHYLGQDQPAASSTVTKIVQSNGSNPDWSAVASTVTSSVVSIQVVASSSEAQGSGVIWDAAGHIVTNNHVVSSLGSGASITVMVGDTSYAAAVVGTDAASDLAVIKLTDPPSGLKPIAVASKSPTVGDPVMAIGNPLGLSSTVTTGIVSALNRPVTTSGTQSQQPSGPFQNQAQTSSNSTVVTNAIQTSAPINPGNSGGALVNGNGELVGINSSIASLSSSSSSSESGSIGIGFAIGASQVQWVADELIASGSVTHATLGVQVSDVQASDSSTTQLGAKIAAVTGGSSADRAGIKTGDVITAVNGAAVDSAESLIAQVRSFKPGTQIKVTLTRAGASQTVTVSLVS